MKRRSPLAVFFLSLITFGIYDLYWLVKTKEVLNKKTSFHTPTIWLLIIPFVILYAGYILLFVGPLIDSKNSSSVTPRNESASSSTVTGTGEEINSQGQRRPPQYLHICSTSDGVQYISQGNPRCLGSDQYRGDYDRSVPGTAYSSPCKTTNGITRYVYVSNAGVCPDGTKLVFRNNLLSSSYDYNLGASSSFSSTGTSIPDDQTADTGVVLVSIVLIGIGFISTFAASIFWFFRFSKAINEYTRGKMSTAVTFLILWLVHLIGVALIQDTFNEMEDGGAATAVAATTPINPVPGYPSSGTPPPSHGPTQPQPQQDVQRPIYPEPVDSRPPLQPSISEESPRHPEPPKLHDHHEGHENDNHHHGAI